MKCPFCGKDDDKVLESRTVNEGESIRRRRECNKCEKRFTSYERVEHRPLMVVKKDGRREPYNREKIMAGISRAVEKRPVSVDDIDDMLDRIEKRLYALNKEGSRSGKEVQSEDVGAVVMDELEKLDQVAYVRFASVYREFKDVKEFVKEIKSLK
jgi:transcriptional repressor NrdR